LNGLHYAWLDLIASLRPIPASWIEIRLRNVRIQRKPIRNIANAIPCRCRSNGDRGEPQEEKKIINGGLVAETTG
jgi:hypothetical protein